jgi:hypothetical protein
MPLIVNEVHDNLVFDIPFHFKVAAPEVIRGCMENLKTLRGMLPDLPELKVETKSGDHWGIE